jgi:hypothetical protein
MPKTVVLFFKDRRGHPPVLDWIDGIERAAQNKVFALVERLEEFGHELRRPHATPLTEEIRELRARIGRVNYAFCTRSSERTGRHCCTGAPRNPKSTGATSKSQ